MQLNIYMRQDVTEALGPGKRYALWVQGCKRNCRGCLSPGSRDFEKGEWIDTLMLAKEIIQTEMIEGLTISGGEPFLQAKALCELVRYIKSKKDYGIIIYTGNLYGELLGSRDIYIKESLAFTDILIDGEYIEELNDGKSLRGSSNQKVLFLTQRYEADKIMFGNEGRNIELYIQNDHMRMVGIPSKGVLDKLGLIEKENGNEWN